MPGEKPVRDAQTERLLKQFTNTDGPKGATAAYKSGWEKVFGNGDFCTCGHRKAKHTEACTADAACTCVAFEATK